MSPNILINLHVKLWRTELLGYLLIFMCKHKDSCDTVCHMFTEWLCILVAFLCLFADRNLDFIHNSSNCSLRDDHILLSQIWVPKKEVLNATDWADVLTSSCSYNMPWKAFSYHTHIQILCKKKGTWPWLLMCQPQTVATAHETEKKTVSSLHVCVVASKTHRAHNKMQWVL